MGAQNIKVIRRRNSPLKDQVSTEQLCKDVCETIKSILGHIFAHPDKMSIEITSGANTVVFEIDLKQEDFGRLLGAKGKNIAAIRTVVSSIMATHGIRAVVSIKDEHRFFD